MRSSRESPGNTIPPIHFRKRHREIQKLIVHHEDVITYRAILHPLERKRDNDELILIAKGTEVGEHHVNDVVRAARRALQLEIRRALTDIETPSHVTPNLTQELSLVMGPVNLLAYMWLTFARVVSGDIKERRCAMCPEYFYLGSGPGLQRDDTITCSIACRKRKQRHER